VDLRIVDDRMEFDGLRAAWTSLALRVKARPFQEYGWAAAWMRTIGATGGRRLCVVTLWDGDRLLAVLPLTIRRFRGIRLLEWIGARTIDYCDALVDPNIDCATALQQMWQGLCRHCAFDVARFGQVRADAKISCLVNELHPWIETTEESQGIPIAWSSGKEWLERQRSKARVRTKSRRRQSTELGFDFHMWQPPDPTEPIVEALIAQKCAWLVAKGQSGFLSEPAGAQFLRELARELAQSGSLHLSAWRSKDVIAACHLGFLRDGVLYYYMPAYEARWAKQGFGSLLLESLLMWACDQGLSRFDMLLGDYEYKTRYDVTAESVRTLVVARGLVGRAALAAYQLSKSRARKLVVKTSQDEQP
jgi:CelD/BcsL family acetyltransferase involved in cellulose biosynthesis